MTTTKRRTTINFEIICTNTTQAIFKRLEIDIAGGGKAEAGGAGERDDPHRQSAPR